MFYVLIHSLLIPYIISYRTVYICDSIRVDGTRVLADSTLKDGRSGRTHDGLGAQATGGHGFGRRSRVDHGECK